MILYLRLLLRPYFLYILDIENSFWFLIPLFDFKLYLSKHHHNFRWDKATENESNIKINENNIGMNTKNESEDTINHIDKKIDYNYDNNNDNTV
jgi:hypothetical protein